MLIEYFNWVMANVVKLLYCIIIYQKLACHTLLYKFISSYNNLLNIDFKHVIMNNIFLEFL